MTAFCEQKPHVHIVLDAAPQRQNLFHFYNDLFIPLYRTLAKHGLLSISAYPNTMLPKASDAAWAC